MPYALFAGCRSGQVLSRYLGGPDITSRLIWEEASTIIGDKPSSCPPADPEHIRAVLERYSPDVVITFGAIAREAVKVIVIEDAPPWNTIHAPHPACRAPKDHAALREACARLKQLI